MQGLESLVDVDWAVNDPQLPEGTPQRRMGALYQPLADFVSSSASSGDLPVSIAGDCCTSLGVLAGLQQAGLDPTLSWFDAHGDFKTYWEALEQRPAWQRASAADQLHMNPPATSS